MDKTKINAILRELDAFQAGTQGMGTAADPVVHTYLLSLSALINRIREILRA